jgi:hypothetical protein
MDKLDLQANLRAVKALKKDLQKEESFNEFIQPILDEFKIFPG